MTRHSPCVGICKLDDATGFCLGCGRTGNEVAEWLTMSEAERDSVWEKLPDRLRKLGVRVRLLRWTPGEIGAWAAEAIAMGRGTWTIGAPTSTAEFSCHRQCGVAVDHDGSGIVARTSGAALRLRFPEKLRAFAVTDGPIVLGLPRRRAAIPTSPAFKRLGSDRDAIDPSCLADALFDCGIGDGSARLCIRTDDAKLIEMLSPHEGRQWSDVISNNGSELRLSRLVYIVESAVARIETLASGTHMAAFKCAEHPAPKEIAKQSANFKLPLFAAPVATFSSTVA